MTFQIYRDMSGVKLPFQMLTTWIDGQTTIRPAGRSCRRAGGADGTYLAAVLTARIYGNPPVGRYLGAHQTLSKFASRALLAWECSFPLVIVLPAPVSYTVLALGAAFHVTNAVLMGLNCFVWSFFAVYPPLLWVIQHRGW